MKRAKPDPIVWLNAIGALDVNFQRLILGNPAKPSMFDRVQRERPWRIT